MIITFIYVFLHVHIRKKGDFSLRCTKVQKAVNFTILLAILASFCNFFDLAIIGVKFSNTSETAKNAIIESPILIDAQAIGMDAHNWTWASSQPWCNGSGTKENPYRISHLEINGMGVNNCIEIRNSKLMYFTIEYCNLHGGGSNISNTIGASILLNNSINGKIYRNTLTESSAQLACGIYLRNCINMNIASNNIHSNYYGILVNHSYTSNVTGNLIQDNEYSGILLEGNSQIINVDHNIITNNLDGIGLVGSSYNWIWDNLIKNNDLDNVICNDCYEIAIQHNNISTSNYGIYIQECSITEISYGNLISENEYGIVIKLSDSNFIEDNKIINNNNYPLWLYHSNNNYIKRNTITGNKGTVTLTDCEGNHLEGNVIFNQPELYLVITIVVLISIASVIGILVYRKIKKRRLE